MKHTLFVCLFICSAVIISCNERGSEKQSGSDMLPVYEVTQPGANDTMVRGLSEKFKIPMEGLTVRNGMISFRDSATYLSIPSQPVTDRALMEKLKARSKDEINDAPIQYDAIDFDALQKRTAPDSATVLKLAADAFTPAGFHLESAKTVIGHTTFSASYTDDAGKKVSVADRQLDTRVSYEFYDKNGYKFTGPGAHVQVTFNSDNKISQLHYAWREVKAVASVKVLPEAEARKRIEKMLPAGAKINMKLVYWCPPFENTKDKAGPRTIIPWYSFTGTVEKKSANGRVTQITTKERLIPATEDSNYIPRVTLKVRGQGTDRVDASVEVAGGHPPYTYVWAGSNPSVLSIDANTVSYQPVIRGEAATAVTSSANESVSVMVTDANGIATQVTEVIPVMAHPLNTPSHGGGTDHGGGACYGCESPGEPEEWTKERQGWQQGMANSGGGTQTFCWLGDASWPGDYIRPKPAGSLPASPWIYGDADYSNWGINTANLVLINGDGWPDGFTAMYPGAPQSAYNSTVDLYRPTNPGSTMVLPIPTNPTYYNVNYNGSWGPTGPNDRLYWLAGLLCDCLDPTDGDGLTPDQRWGPAFGGLHIFTGFSSGAAYSAGAFPKAFAENILGVGGAAQTIKDGWFNASNATNEGSAAAMGPITTGGVTDLNDHYIGKGSRGPTISGAAITGWWYLHQ